MISAKQVEGAVDTTSPQTIQAEKTFSLPTNFSTDQGDPFVGMRIEGLYMYWLKSFDRLDEENNFRIGPNIDTNKLVMQRFENGEWIDTLNL
jgi:hypothetical protein